MFDENSFDQSSFSITSWLFGVVAAAIKYFRQIFVGKQSSEVVITKVESDVWVNRKIS